jgi:hypothetical protein
LGEEIVRTLCCDGASKFIGKGQLLKLKLKAIRAGVWFRALPRIDRVLVDLTIKVAQSIRSPFLASSILSVARKLEGLLESKFARAIREVGFPLACKLSILARGWGNRNAWAWAGDETFARYLAVMKLNG